jgi:D-serine deaminase-like pyridoxal phosphate-dependent protein
MLKSVDMLPITKPTLVLDEGRARRNIERMASRARRLGVRFRPHFKTHQSRHIGRLFRDYGVEAITVSSVDMAAYFADDGWRDILIAFPLNILEAVEIGRLASRCRLGILVESAPGLAALARSVASPLDVWIKINVGANRAGAEWDDRALLAAIGREAARYPPFRLRGLLTHNGRTYSARTLGSLSRVHADAMRKMRRAKRAMAADGFPDLEISVGDTPACSRLDDFSGADEIRPGNFVLHDVTQLELGSCGATDIAAAVACPVVSMHPSRNEAVIFGGAIHLSKEDFRSLRGGRIYGRACRPRGAGWGGILPGTAVSALSQEHGIVKTTALELKRIKAGDVLYILPIHSCLTVNLWDRFKSLDGADIPTIRSCSF